MKNHNEPNAKTDNNRVPFITHFRVMRTCMRARVRAWARAQ
jgi:hypothetical protein